MASRAHSHSHSHSNAMEMQMDSIWLEDDTRNKLYNVSLPNVEVLNSETPYLPSCNTLDLPPLPPTSYYTTFMSQKAQEEENNRASLKSKKSSGKLLNAFMNSFKGSSTQKNTQRDKPRIRTKISTPFGFSHISHVDKSSTITHRTFEIPVPESYGSDIDTSTEAVDPSSTQGIAFNRTEPTPRTSTYAYPSSTIPRSASLANSMSSNTFSSTRASVSTMATSTKAISRKNTQSHHSHTVSSSSIEQLAKLEQFQISKQCQPEYTSTQKKLSTSSSTSSPDSTPALNKDTLAWDTPSPGNAVRQSWIYAIDNDISPMSQREKSRKMYTHTENTMIRESLLLMNIHTPVKEQIEKFTSALNVSFDDESSEFAAIAKSMNELNVMFGVNDSPNHDVDEVEGEIASMRAANFTRISRDLIKDIGEGGMKEFKRRLNTVLKENDLDFDLDLDLDLDEELELEVSTVSSEDDLKPSLV